MADPARFEAIQAEALALAHALTRERQVRWLLAQSVRMPRRLGWVMVLLVGCWLSTAHLSHAQSVACAQLTAMEPAAYETLTVSTVAVGFTASVINGVSATAAFVTVESQPLRYKLFGTPTATDGHLVEPPSTGNAEAGKGAWFCGAANLRALRLIRSGGTDSTVRVTYFRIP